MTNRTQLHDQIRKASADGRKWNERPSEVLFVDHAGNRGTTLWNLPKSRDRLTLGDYPVAGPGANDICALIL